MMICAHEAKDTCFSKVSLFQHLDESEAALLSSLLHTRRYNKGEMVVQEGERSDTLYVIHQGCVKLSKYNENGKEHIIRFLFPGDFFGQDSLLHQNHMPRTPKFWSLQPSAPSASMILTGYLNMIQSLLIISCLPFPTFCVKPMNGTARLVP